MPIIMAASGESETPKKIAVYDDTVGENEEFWFRTKWNDSEAFSK